MYGSIYKISFITADGGEIPLVDYKDDVLTRVPDITGVQDVQVRRKARSAHAFVQARGNAVRSVVFDRVLKFADGAPAAEQWKLEHLELMKDLKRGALSMQVIGQTAKTVEDAAITVEQLESSEACPGDEITMVYTVTGGAITGALTAGTPISPTGAVLDENGDTVVFDIGAFPPLP